MNAIKRLAIFLLTVGPIIFATSCSKNNTSVSTSSVVLKLNGAQPPIDSIKTTVGMFNSAINAINIQAYTGSSWCKIQLYFSPSDPLFASGAVLDFATTRNAGIVYYGSGKPYYDDYMTPGHSGIITITKNNAGARRIEGTLTKCVVSPNSVGGSPITIDGNFAVTYPAQ